MVDAKINREEFIKENLPLVHSICRRFSGRGIEYDDLYQMCMYTMIKLYRANYHLNTSLLKRSFNNEVLMHIRKNKNSPIVLSLDSSSYVNKDGEDIRIEDTVTDYSALYDMYEVEEKDAKEKELDDKKSLVLDVISKRQYDQLVREYGNKITTNAGRHTVSRIKQKLKNKGITPELFFRHHESNKGDN
jgi:RNA polymerase sigma factor (sigma-70 family)